MNIPSTVKKINLNPLFVPFTPPRCGQSSFQLVLLC